MKIFSELCSISTNVYRVIQKPSLRQYFGSQQITDLRLALSVLEHCSGSLARMLFPFLLSVESDTTISRSIVLNCLESSFSCVEDALDSMTIDMKVSDENAHNVVCPLLTNVVPTILLYSMNSDSSNSLVFSVAQFADRLANRLLPLVRLKTTDGLSGFDWADRIARLCVAASAQAYALIIRGVDQIGVLDSVPKMQLWLYFDLPENTKIAYIDFDAPVDQSLSFESFADHESLRCAHARKDGGYRLLLNLLEKNNTGSMLKQIECAIWKALWTALSRFSFPPRIEEWRYVAEFMNLLFLKRHKYPDLWPFVLEGIVKLSEFGMRFIEILIPQRFPFPLPRMWRTQHRIRAVFNCIFCALRWRRLMRNPRRQYAESILEPFNILKELLLSDAEKSSKFICEKICSAFVRRLHHSQELCAKRMSAMGALATYISGPLFEINPFAVLDAVAKAESPPTAFLCCTFSLRVTIADKICLLFQEGLIGCTSRVTHRLSDPSLSSITDLNLALAAFRAIIVHISLLSTVFEAIMDQSKQILLKLFEFEAFSKDSQTRMSLREVGRVVKLLMQFTSSTLLQLTTSYPKWSISYSALQEVILTLLSHNFLACNPQENHTQGTNSNADDSIRICSDDNRQGQRKRSQEILTRPRQFSRDQEGIVIQGDRLYTNFKGIDFTLSFWLFLRKRTRGKYSFIAGKLSHAEAWPLILVRADLRIEVIYGKGSDFEHLISKQTLMLNAWVHVCVVTEPRKIKLYIGGNLDNAVGTNGNTRASLYPLVIGNCPASVRTKVEHVHEGFEGLLASFVYHVRNKTIFC